VRPAYRRQGVGRALLGVVGREIRARGHVALYNSSQADEAERQVSHRHVGFAECGFLAGVNAGGVGEVFFRNLL
jgi:GNAT superfamily N-acetyltransferase